MAREIFKNLPDTSTPLSASKLNGIFNGEESMGSIVVEDVECKNVYKATSYRETGYTSNIPNVGTNSGITVKSFDSNNISISINDNAYVLALSNIMQLKPNTEYTFSFNAKSENVNSARVFLYEIDNSDNYNLIIRLTATKYRTYTFTTGDTGKFVVGFGSDNTSSGGTLDITDIQLEKGAVATSYVENKEFDNAIVQANVDALASKLNVITKNTGSSYETTFKGSLTGRYIFMYMAILNGGFGLAGTFVIDNGTLKTHKQFVSDTDASAVTITASTTDFTIKFARNYTVCTIISPNVALT